MEHIQNSRASPPAPGDPFYINHLKNSADLRMAIMNSLPQELIPAIELKLKNSPPQLTEAINNHSTEYTYTAHTILRQEAHRKKFAMSKSLDTYLQTLRYIRLIMRLADYPGTQEDESTTIDFIIQGLETHESFKHLYDMRIEPDTMSTTLKSRERRLRSVQARVAERDTTIETTPQGIQIAPAIPTPTVQNNEPRRYRGRSRGRGRAQPQWARPWIPHTPTYAQPHLHSYTPAVPYIMGSPQHDQTTQNSPPQAPPTRAQPSAH